MKRRRSPKRATPSLSRLVARRPVKKTVVVFCEGTKTEPKYIEALKNEPAVRDIASVDIRLEATSGGEVPLTLVRRAAELRAKAGVENAEIDEIWCIFDVEWPTNHPHLREAIQLARDKRIQLAISNPCFELWLILHFRNCEAWLDNNQARRARRECDGQTEKGLDPALYMSRLDLAVRNAAALDRKHKQDQTLFPHNNPSSGMYLFVLSVSPT